MSHTYTVAQIIAHKLAAIANCKRVGNDEWEIRHGASLELMLQELPSGSGFDCGTKLDETSTAERLVFNVSFHHMDEHGGYDGWTDHQVIVRASLVRGIDLRVTGRNKREIKDYIAEVFHESLSQIRPMYTETVAA